MRDTFRASWRAQVFYFLGAYCLLRAFDVLYSMAGGSTEMLLWLSIAILVISLGISLYTHTKRWLTMTAGFLVGYLAFRVITGPGRTAALTTLPTSRALTILSLFVATGAATLVLARFIRARDLADGDEERTQTAERALREAVRLAGTGHRLRHCLYLRPFAITDRLRYAHPEARTIATPEDYERARRVDVERLLAEALEEHAPLIALGLPGEHHGAGRIVSDETAWRDTVTVLVNAVQWVILLPSYHDGTQWEIGHLLKSRAIDKTLFVMPPSSPLHQQDVVEFWARTSEETKRRWQLMLPSYRDTGALFTIGRDHVVESLTALPLHSLRALKDAVLVGGGRSTADPAPEARTVQLSPSRPRKASTISYAAVALGFILCSVAVMLLERLAAP